MSLIQDLEVHPRAGQLVQLISEFQPLLASALKSIPQTADCWYTERSLVALLAAAAWKLDWPTMTEVKSKKHQRDGPDWQGYIDLVTHAPQGELAIEAKVTWINGEGHLANVQEALSDADADARSLPEDFEGTRFAAAFVMLDCTSIGVMELHGKILERINSVGVDFVAGVVRTEIEPYPGGVLVGRAVS